MSRLSNILPLIFLFLGVGVAAFIGFVVYSIVQDVKSQTQKKMEKKNVMFSRDGMKVGVKEVDDEEYKDRSQRYGIYVPPMCLDCSSLLGGISAMEMLTYDSSI